jgi:hypothetical protein
VTAPWIKHVLLPSVWYAQYPPQFSIWQDLVPGLVNYQGDQLGQKWAKTKKSRGYFLCSLANWPDMQKLEYRSNGYIDMDDFWWRVMIWAYEQSGEVSAHLDHVWRYFLHNDTIWTENEIISWGRLAQGNELIFGIQGWFVKGNHPEKFQLNWIKE